MQSTWDIMHHMDTSAMSAADTMTKLEFCPHSIAISSLHQSGALPYGSMVDRDPVYSLGDFNFSCENEPVCLIRSSPSLLISCDFGNGRPLTGRTRAFIRTNQQRRYVCGSCTGAAASNCKAHLEPLQEWLDSESAMDAGIFESYSFKSSQHGVGQGACDDSNPSKSVSSSPIRLDMFNKAMENRAKCGGFRCIHLLV